MYKTKIFYGMIPIFEDEYIMADDQFNEWIKNNPNISIISVQYQHVDRSHSIFIFYKEEE